LREFVGFEKLELQPAGPFLRKTVGDLQIDVGAIAPGLAVDQIAERFEALGVRDYLVELGGEVRDWAQSADRPWRVAVEAPLAGERRPYALVELDGPGVSTSGDYRDFHMWTGRSCRTPSTRHRRSGGTRARIGLRGAPIDGARRRLCNGTDGSRTRDGMKLAERLGLAALFIERGRDEWRVQSAGHARIRAFARPLE